MAAKQSKDFCNNSSGVDMVDTASFVDASFLTHMKDVGVGTVARYYDYEDETLPGKLLRPNEPNLIAEFGMKLLVVFQHHNNKASTFKNWRTRGPKDAQRCLDLADQIEQPEGSAIYFGVDGDFFGDIGSPTGPYKDTHHSNDIIGYFSEIKEAFLGKYKIGVYGGGACVNALKNKGLADYRWLSHSHGFVGSKEAAAKGEYEIEQYLPGKCGGRSVDFDKFRTGIDDVGAF